MIRLYDKQETDFNHTGIILNAIKCEVKEEENGQFELEFESLLDTRIVTGCVLKVPTPRGEQLFRVYNPTHTLRKTTAKARHIFYDLLGNFLEDTRPTSTNGSGAINAILGGTLYPHNFIGTSTVANVGTAYYVRKNPVQAILGADNALIANWGGYIKRNNFKIEHIVQGADRGYEVRYGKNLKGIKESIDDSKVVTKLMPTWVVDNVVQMLPEKYIDSPLIGSYSFPKVGELRIDVPEEVEDKISYVRAEANKYFSEHHIDEPLVNYKIDFINLRKVKEYEDFVWTEELDLYDVVTTIVPKMNIRLSSNVISYEFDAIKERFNSIEIGNFKNSLAKNTSTLIKDIDKNIEVKSSELIAKQQEATDKLAGVTGGNIVINRTPDGKPYEILVMDTDSVATATNVVRINQQGIGFSDKGVIGPYGVAVTIDGHIVADYIDVGTLAAEIIKSGVFSDKTGRFYLNMETGAFNFGNKLTYDPATGQFKIDGSMIVNAINGTNLDISGKNIQLDGNTSIAGNFQVTGSNIKLTGNTSVDGSFTLNGESIYGIISNTINNTSGKMNSSYRDANIYGSQTGLNGNDKRFHFNYGNNSFDIQGRLDVYTDSMRKHTFELNGLSLNTSAGTAEIKPWTNTVNFHTSKPVDFNRGVQVPSLRLNGKLVSVDSNGFLKV